MMREVPLGWNKWPRFDGSYVSEDGMHLVFISENKNKFNVKILGEFPDEEDNIRSFGVNNEKDFNTYDEAWNYARKEMMKITSENKIRQKYSRKKKVVKTKVKRCRCKK